MASLSHLGVSREQAADDGSDGDDDHDGRGDGKLGPSREPRRGGPWPPLISHLARSLRKSLGEGSGEVCRARTGTLIEKHKRGRHVKEGEGAREEGREFDLLQRL